MNSLKSALSLPPLDGVSRLAVVVIMAILSDISPIGTTAHYNGNVTKLVQLLEVTPDRIDEALQELECLGVVRLRRGCIIVGTVSHITGVKLTNFRSEDGIYVAAGLQQTLSEYGDNLFAKSIKDIVVQGTVTGSLAPKEQGNVFRFAHQLVLGKPYRYLNAKEYGQLKNFFKLFATVDKAVATIISYWGSNCSYGNVAGLLMKKDSLIAKSDTVLVKNKKYEDDEQPF